MTEKPDNWDLLTPDQKDYPAGGLGRADGVEFDNPHANESILVDKCQ